MFSPLGKKSQLKLLEEHFGKCPSISAMEAQALYRIRALPRRIKDLKERGILTCRHEEKVDATGQRYVRYYALPKAA